MFEYPGKSTGGSRTPIAIIILIKNPKKKKHTIHYHVLEDKYYSGQNKRDRIKELKSIQGIKDWQTITPDKHHDWLGQRSDEFERYVAMGDKQTKSGKNTISIFRMYSMGVTTSRDVWAYNSSKYILTKNMKSMINYCNMQNLHNPTMNIKQVKWSPGLTDRLKKSKPQFVKNQIRMSLYRPFFKQYLYFDKTYNHRPAQIPKIFPKQDLQNFVIIVPHMHKGIHQYVLLTLPQTSKLCKMVNVFLYTYTKTETSKPTSQITS